MSVITKLFPEISGVTVSQTPKLFDKPPVQDQRLINIANKEVEKVDVLSLSKQFDTLRSPKKINDLKIEIESLVKQDPEQLPLIEQLAMQYQEKVIKTNKPKDKDIFSFFTGILQPKEQNVPMQYEDINASTLPQPLEGL
jgi:hypothetical protein